MIADFFLLFPAITCLNWAFLLFISRKQVAGRVLLSAIAALAGVLFLFNAITFHENLDYRLTAWMDFFARMITLTLFPMFVCFLRKLLGQSTNDWFITILYTPAALFSTMLLTVYMFLGVADASSIITDWHNMSLQEFFGIGRKATNFLGFAYIIYLLIILAWLTAVGVLAAKAFRNEIVKGHSERAMYASCILFALLLVRFAEGNHFLTTHVYLLYTLFAALGGACVIFFHELDTLYVDTEKEANEDEAIVEELDSENRDSMPAPNGVSSSLVQKFETYIRDEKPYLDPNLSIEDVATALGSNRTYVSSMINYYYGLTFRLYINLLRIEEAKMILRENPEELLDTVAEKSGFAGSSQLVRKFREIAGEPPKLWANRRAYESSQSNAAAQHQSESTKEEN